MVALCQASSGLCASFFPAKRVNTEEEEEEEGKKKKKKKKEVPQFYIYKLPIDRHAAVTGNT